MTFVWEFSTVLTLSRLVRGMCAILEEKQRVYPAQFGLFQTRLERRHAPDVRGLPGAASFFYAECDRGFD